MKNLKTEIIRKFFHINACFIVPVLLVFFNVEFLRKIVFFLTLILFIVDYFNLYERLPKNPIMDFFMQIARGHETQKYRISGTTWAFLAFTILLIFDVDSKIIALSFIILAISDTFAAFIGMKFGRIKFFNKSLEGFIAFFVSALLISVIYLKILNAKSNPVMLSLICLITAVAELFAKKIDIDDNFLIPVVFSILFSIL